MTHIIEGEGVLQTVQKGTVTFEGVRAITGRPEATWSAAIELGQEIDDNPFVDAGVSISAATDDQGRTWFAVHGSGPSGGLTLEAQEARAIAFLLLDVPDAVEDPNDEYRDPMEEPGAWACGDCGLYPLAAGEHHDCP